MGRENGRYGGYRSAVVLTPDAPAAEGPRYRIRLEHLTASVYADRPWIRGTRVEIFDSHTQELVARWTDFRFRGESCFKVPASKPHEERVDGNLAFIHRVLVPKPGVEIIHKDLPTIHERSTVRPDAIQQVVAAKVVKTWADLRTHLQSIDRALPEGVAYGAVTVESWDDRGNRSVHWEDSKLVFKQPARDIVVAQGLGWRAELLALTEHRGEYVALFTIGDPPEGHPEYVLLRRFGKDGDLLAQARVNLPDAIPSRVHCPSRTLNVEGKHYRVTIALFKRHELFDQIELEIPRI